MTIKVANNAYSTLAGSITDVATSLSVQTGHGARFPSLSAGEYFYATLIDSSNNLEIIKVTARSTDAFTIERGAEGTTNRAYTSGDRIELRITAGTITDFAAGTLAPAVASAGTVTLQAGALTHITGVTTITDVDLTPANDGAWAMVVFDGILTLTHNATTLMLPGGANITTAAGDRAIFVQDATDNVVCLMYQRAAGNQPQDITLDELSGINGVVGDILYADGTDSWVALAAGDDDDVLTLASGVPTWAAPGGGGGGFSTVKETTYLASGNFVPNANANAYEIVVIGAGGNGINGSNNNSSTGRGGSAAGLVVAGATKAEIGNSTVVVTIGTPGNDNNNGGNASSFGSFVTANSGRRANSYNNSSSLAGGNGTSNLASYTAYAGGAAASSTTRGTNPHPVWPQLGDTDGAVITGITTATGVGQSANGFRAGYGQGGKGGSGGSSNSNSEGQQNGGAALVVVKEYI